jgi:hypothetical protein
MGNAGQETRLLQCRAEEAVGHIHQVNRIFGFACGIGTLGQNQGGMGHKMSPRNRPHI